MNLETKITIYKFTPQLFTLTRFFKPDEWTDQQGVKHNRIIMAVTDFYEPVEKEEEKAPVASKKKKAKKAA